MTTDENVEPTFGDVENEPSPYGLKEPSASARRKAKKAQEGGNRTIVLSSIVGMIVVVCVATGGYAIYRATHHAAETQGNALNSAVAAPGSSPASASASTLQTAPSINIGIQKANGKLRLVVRWNDLPDATTKIDVYYSATENGNYRLIGSIAVAPGTSSGGSGYLSVPNGYQNGYYYGAAATSGGSTLWASTSTPPSDVSSGTNNETQSGNSGGNISPSNSSGTSDFGVSSTSVASGTNNTAFDASSSASASVPTPGESFLVQHADMKIQISWQTLPANTSKVVVSRSASTSGPWVPVLTETSITTYGPYSLEIVDETLGDPYYYKMTVYDAAGAVIETFGPTFLAPL